MISDRYKQLFEICLADIARQAMSFIHIMPLGDHWIGYLLLADISQVVVEHPQGDQPSSDGRWCPSQALLTFDESIHIMYSDGFRRSPI
jgi:hypothetical protein